MQACMHTCMCVRRGGQAWADERKKAADLVTTHLDLEEVKVLGSLPEAAGELGEGGQRWVRGLRSNVSCGEEVGQAGGKGQLGLAHVGHALPPHATTTTGLRVQRGWGWGSAHTHTDTPQGLGFRVQGEGSRAHTQEVQGTRGPDYY